MGYKSAKEQKNEETGERKSKLECLIWFIAICLMLVIIFFGVIWEASNDEARVSHKVAKINHLKVDVQENFILSNVAVNYLVGGHTNNNREVLFHCNYDARIVNKSIVSVEAKEELQVLVSKFTVDKIPLRARSSFISYRNFRMDMQGLVWVPDDKRFYYNIQVQRNELRRCGQSTTYSQVLVAVNDTAYLTDRVIRKAFLESFVRIAGVKLTMGDSINNQSWN